MTKVLYTAPNTFNKSVGIPLGYGVINNNFYLLLLLDDGTFEQARAVCCQVIEESN